MLISYNYDMAPIAYTSISALQLWSAVTGLHSVSDLQLRKLRENF